MTKNTFSADVTGLATAVAIIEGLICEAVEVQLSGSLKPIIEVCIL
jgi:hypothetical protein